MSSSVADVRAAIDDYLDPFLGVRLQQANVVKDIVQAGDQINVEIELGFPSERYAPELESALRDAIAERTPEANVSFAISSQISARSVQRGVSALKGVKNTIAVASGKGGVGKSTTAVNLALALKEEGASVGILDADIYGPSQPRMLGTQGRPESPDGKSIEPLVNHGIQSISIGNLVDEETPMIWRGPMATGALEQLLRDTRWHDVDYLIMDLPPGTGDIQLTLCQKIPLTAAAIVTTPQNIALLDARKGLKMFEKVNVPVVGIIENMSIHVCSACGHAEHIFGEGGGAMMAEDYDVPLLGCLPLDRRIRESVDNGMPTIIAEPDSLATQNYRTIARSVAARVSLLTRDMSAKFPKIVIENT